MPRQHVYGKRSRAIYDPSAIFSSPQRAEKFTAKAIASARVTRVVDCLRDLQISEQPEKYRDTSNGSSQRMRRVALGKRSTNSVVNPDFSIETKTIKSEKQKVKTVVQERKLCMEGGGNKFGRHAEVPEQSIGRKLPEEDRPAPLELEGYMKNDRSGNAVIPETINDAKIPTNALHRSTQRRLRKEEAKTNQRDQVDSHTPTDSTLSKFPELQPEKNIYTEHCRSLLKLSSHSLTSFSDWSEQLSHHFTLSKIAEASFGEVYRISLLHPIPGLSAGDESVFKVIALRAPPATLPSDKRKRKAAMKKADAMSSPDEVANEVLVLQRMRSIPGFTNYRDVRIVQGRPPILFVEAFRAFNRTQRAAKKDPSIFPDPGRKGSYSPDQLWAVIEMQDAGTDLEHLIDQDVASKATVAPGSLHALSSIWTVWDIFWQVVLALAKGEEGAEFEHRDLHLGNICVREATNHKTLSSLIRKAGEDDSIDVTRKLGFTRWEITLIDYTISRCRLVQFSPSSDTSRDGIAFADLALHASLFDGDATEEYQYEIYRYMRDAFFSSGPSGSRNDPARYKRDEGPQSSQKREWQEYNPITNLVWLHFILHKLLAQLSRPSLQHAPPTAKKYRLTHMQWKRANDLEHALDRLSRLLNPEVLVRGGDGFLTRAWCD
ncbi:MAG: hypothetical protein FE78DRAFT_99160 [Acidomyces sp. 'richmondensis']|nr:MAG: hypothetical protein FE78DRAFT_99160 [Acidomyces sp. 'richmondensis']